MSQNEVFRDRAAECRRKADAALNEPDKQTWLRLAEGWLLLVKYRQTAEQKLDDAKHELETLQQELG
jgi:hypothetical protein